MKTSDAVSSYSISAAFDIPQFGLLNSAGAIGQQSTGGVRG